MKKYVWLGVSSTHAVQSGWIMSFYANLTDALYIISMF